MSGDELRRFDVPRVRRVGPEDRWFHMACDGRGCAGCGWRGSSPVEPLAAKRELINLADLRDRMLAAELATYLRRPGRADVVFDEPAGVSLEENADTAPGLER
jgi:hypothetical protein